MDASDDCTTFVKAWEGIKDGDPSTVNLDPYMDMVGVWTIGYGHALRDPTTNTFLRGPKDKGRAFGQFPGGITMARATALLSHDLEGFAASVTATAGANTSQHQFDALLSFDFNTGGLRGSSLARLHTDGAAAGDLPTDEEVVALRDQVRGKQITKPASIRNAFAVWSNANKVFAGGLFCRRLAEFAFYRDGDVAAANAFGNHVRSLIAH